jgi:hypothetical protein
VLRLKALVDKKNSAAKVVAPVDTALTNKLDVTNANRQVKEAQLSPVTDNLMKDRIDTEALKAGDLTAEQLGSNKETEAVTKQYTDQYKDEYDAYKNEYNDMKSGLEKQESEQKARLDEWNKSATEELMNRQMGQQAEATQKLGKLGASE